MSLVLPPCPPSLKPIQHYLKAATEHETRDPVVAYWCRLYALQTALKIDKKSDEAKLLLVRLMDWLELEKRNNSGNEAITNDIAAQAHVENYALKLFMWADGQDRVGIFNKNVVKAFYTAGILMDILNIFGELSEDIAANCKYAKWKAAYIHNCLKNGETPVPGPIGPTDGENENEGAIGFIGGATNYRPDDGISEPKLPVQPPSDTLGFTNIPASNPSPTPNIAQPSETDTRPYSPSQPSSTSSSNAALVAPGTGVKLDPSLVTKAQKYCKFAASALNYDDVADAVNYLQKALRILETGQEN